MDAVFRAPTPYMSVIIAIPMYAEGNKGVWLEENRKPQYIGTDYLRCCFCEGRDHNQLTLQDARDIAEMRAYIEHNEGFMEVSCDEAAAMLGGSNKTKGRDHEQHKKELQNKYGDGEEDHELSEWDRKHFTKMLKG